MTERPILFSAEMVRAILDGRKTQTRWVIKPQPTGATSWLPHMEASGFYPNKIGAEPERLVCKYGAPGDLLWVRETWARHASGVDYAADFAAVSRPQAGPWRPSIHMPRWASRITLEVKSVRVERLQDISEDDARAEGAPADWEPGVARALMQAVMPTACFSPHLTGFARLWNHIHGPGAWDANPWVWAISFERVKP